MIVFSMFLISLAQPVQGIYPYADHPLSYGFFLCGILCVTGALFYLAVDRLSRPPEKRHGAVRIRAQGEGALPPAEPLGWREKLAPALLFSFGSVLAAFIFPTSIVGFVTVINIFGSMVLFSLGIHFWLASINRKLGVEPGSRFLPERSTGISRRSHEFACGAAFSVATIQFYWMLPRTEVLLWWPLVFVPLLAPQLLIGTHGRYRSMSVIVAV